MKKTVFLWLLVVSLITTALLVPVSLVLYYHVYEARIEEDLFVELGYIESFYSDASPREKLITGARRLTVISSDGSVLFDSEADENAMGNHNEREEVREARENGIGISERQSDTLSQKSIYAAKRLSDGTVIRLSTEAKTAFSFLSLIFLPLLFVILVVFIIMSVLSGFVAKKIVEPINALNLDSPGDNETYEELSPLLLRLKKEKESVKEQIEKSEEKKREFELISSSLDEGLAIVNSEGVLLSSNNSFITLLSAYDITSPSVFSYFQEGDGKSALICALSGERKEVIFPIGERMIEEVAYPSDKGGIIILLRNVTERVERENMRKEFTANVSHELKTPLTTISGFAELLMSGTVPSDKVADFSSEIYREAGRLIALVEDILNLSSLDENNEEVKDKVELVPVAEDVVSELEFKAEKKGVKILSDITPASIKGNAKLVHEIIFNLLDNAIRYCGTENPFAKLSSTVSSDSVTIAVEDNGIGIAREQTARVFERFYRVDKARSKSDGGTGLGLSIVKNAALRMNGKINITSDLGKGTKIEITFPLYS